MSSGKDDRRLARASVPRDDALIARAFESWIHRDALHRMRGEPGGRPLQADPPAGTGVGGPRPGQSERGAVLTGEGGGKCRPTRRDRRARPPTDPSHPDRYRLGLGLVASERLDPADLASAIDSDNALAAKLVGMMSAFAAL
jgi:hypothetical protein